MLNRDPFKVQLYCIQVKLAQDGLQRRPAFYMLIETLINDGRVPRYEELPSADCPILQQMIISWLLYSDEICMDVWGKE